MSVSASPTKRKCTPLGTALAGANAGMFAVTMSYPFDLIKTRSHFEVSKGGAGKVSITSVGKKIWAEGVAAGGSVKGFTSFYRGLDQLMPEAAFKTMLRFFVFKRLQNTYKERMGLDQMTVVGNLLCGATAGAIETTLVVQPFERGKTLKADFQKPFQVYGDAYRAKGLSAAIRSIYTGYLPCLGRQVGNQATAFTVFYGIKQRWVKAKGTTHMSTLENLSFGFLSGASACCVTMPMDVVKSIAQRETGSNARSSMQIARSILAEKGITGLYAGLTPRIGRVGMDRAFGFLAFEYLSQLLAKNGMLGMDVEE